MLFKFRPIPDTVIIEGTICPASEHVKYHAMIGLEGDEVTDGIEGQLILNFDQPGVKPVMLLSIRGQTILNFSEGGMSIGKWSKKANQVGGYFLFDPLTDNWCPIGANALTSVRGIQLDLSTGNRNYDRYKEGNNMVVPSIDKIRDFVKSVMETGDA